MTTLDRLNKLTSTEFVEELKDLFEHSPWIVEGTVADRPFFDGEAFYTALVEVLDATPVEAKVELIKAHPDLAGKLAVAGELTDFSAEEQQSARLDQLTAEQFKYISALNERYRERFGFPFVICVKEQTQESIFEHFAKRVENERSVEIEAALTQIKRIAWHRLQSVLG
jgi:2-oxo-4-hydroxy-4-carboxy-5-ureidoimidazoline decarboxylase